MAEIDPQIGKNLRAARRHSGITQEELAHALGVDKVTVSRWENGVRRIKAEDYQKAMELLVQTNYNPIAVGAVGVDRVVELNQSAFHSVSEQAKPYQTSEDSWSPNPALVSKIPKRAYEVAISYCRRLHSAGWPREEIDEIERLMIDPRYAQANKRKGVELSVDDHIMLIDATWEAVKHTAAALGRQV